VRLRLFTEAIDWSGIFAHRDPSRLSCLARWDLYNG
jgi:hypothetical protein